MRIIIIFILTLINLYSQAKYALRSDIILVEKAIEIALTQKGLKETTGKNDGPHIEEYMKVVGLNPKKGYPYCAAGIYWSFYNASIITGIKNPIPKNALANGIYAYAKTVGEMAPYIPERGDLLVWKERKNLSGHIEIVLKPHRKGNVITFGFNTGGANPREGQGNYIKYRSIFNPLGKLIVRGIVGFKY